MSENQSPRSWRWLWWTLAILVLLLFCGHAIWTSVAGSRFSRKIEALRKAGEPILPSDFALTGFDAPENAGADILAAARLIDSKDPRWDAYQRLEELKFPLRDDERRILIAASEAIAPSLQRLEAARGKTRFVWDIDFTKPMSGMFHSGFNQIRELGSALVVQAIVDHEHQLDRAAVDRLEQVLFISQLPDRHPSLVGHLISIGLDGLAADWLINLTPDLRIGTGPNDASPDQVRRIIARLLDETSARESLVFSLRGERMFEVEMVNSVVNGMPTTITSGIAGAAPHPAARYALRPLYYRAGMQLIDNMNAMLAAVAEKSLPAANSKLPSYTRSSSPLDAISNQLVPSFNGVIASHYRSLTERQFAAVALAVRWYAIDHDGQLPQTLQELVPTYLPAVPIDRLSASLNSLGYKPTSDAPIVYSVGVDGKDDGGSEAPINPNRRRRGLPINEWEMLDRVQPLYRRTRPPPPATDQSGN